MNKMADPWENRGVHFTFLQDFSSSILQVVAAAFELSLANVADPLENWGVRFFYLQNFPPSILQVNAEIKSSLATGRNCASPFSDPVKYSVASTQIVKPGVRGGASNIAGNAVDGGAAVSHGYGNGSDGGGSVLESQYSLDVMVIVKYNWLWFEVMVDPNSTIGDVVRMFTTEQEVAVRDRWWRILHHEMYLGPNRLLYMTTVNYQD